VSVGVAVAEVPDQPIEDLVASADAALYRAKRAGRDRVVSA
jgi:PleD family two-component response regulator